jgi:hypothetical protein
LATVNGVGDFVASALVGFLWAATQQTGIAFGTSAILGAAGTVLLLALARPGRPA